MNRIKIYIQIFLLVPISSLQLNIRVSFLCFHTTVSNSVSCFVT